MSRIGNRPIPFPSGVEIKVAGGQVSVKGPKGQLARPVPDPIGLDVEDGRIVVKRPDDRKQTRAMQGLTRALVQNMVTGVTDGFAKELQIEGVGYRADVQGKKLTLSLGFSHPVEMQIPDGLKVGVDRNTVLKVEGIDRQAVGQFAADIRSLRPPEPYKGKGIRYSDERVRRKVGKAGAA